MQARIISLPEMRDRRFVFKDRGHSGAVIAKMLADDQLGEAVVFGIPAGGVPVALPISEALAIPFDVAVVSKITLPWSTEAGYGAIAFDGTIRMNEMLLARLNLKRSQIEKDMEKTMEKVRRRDTRLRGTRPFPSLKNKTAVLVDDGLASGFTMFCAIDAMKNKGAQRIRVAVPTAHEEAAEAAARLVDRLYCPNIRSGMPFAVAEAYERWHDVSDEELMGMLTKKNL